MLSGKGFIPVLVTISFEALESLNSSRAAQYVRMSTDKQQYSPLNQMAAIAAYAARRNLAIVRTYADEGRSGLDLGGRTAIQNLLSDVRNGKADYKVILVYDVSRWGRFQDADESAYYELSVRKPAFRCTIVPKSSKMTEVSPQPS